MAAHDTPPAPSASSQAMAESVVVFDFDHTLTDWDCSARFFR